MFSINFSSICGAVLFSSELATCGGGDDSGLDCCDRDGDNVRAQRVCSEDGCIRFAWLGGDYGDVGLAYRGLLYFCPYGLRKRTGGLAFDLFFGDLLLGDKDSLVAKTGLCGVGRLNRTVASSAGLFWVGDGLLEGYFIAG